MDNKNIIFNHTLEQYNKKYRNHRYRLLKIAKKEVEDFDKKNHTNTKGYLLRDRKWWLIGDTYYEIPKAPRYTWFRNLNSTVQVGCCLLGVGVVATAVTVPLVLMQPTHEDKKEEKIEAEVDNSLSNDFKLTLIKKDSDGNTVISLENISSEKYAKELEIYKGEKLLEVDVDYAIQDKEKNKDIIINKESINKYSGKIKIKSLYDEFDGKVTEEEWVAAFKYLCVIKDDTNYTCHYEYEDEENEMAKEIIKIDYDFNQKLEGENDFYQKLLSNGSIIQFGDDGLIYSLLDKFDQTQYLSKYIAELSEFGSTYESFEFSDKDKYYYFNDEGTKYIFKFKKKGNLVLLDYHSMGETYFIKFENYGTTKVTFTSEIKNFIEYSGTPSAGIYEFSKYTFAKNDRIACYRINLEGVEFEDGKSILINVPVAQGVLGITEVNYVVNGKLTESGTQTGFFYINNSVFESEKSKDFTFIVKVNNTTLGDYKCVLEVNQ